MRLRRAAIGRFGQGILIAGALMTWLAATASATTPAAGARGNYRGQCRRLTHQINYYEKTVMPMAIARGNRGWEKATHDQVEHLWNRRADLCPAYGAQRTLLQKAADQARRVKQFLASAARAAAAYFSDGLMGGVGP